MDKLYVNFKNCYGISQLEHEFVFESTTNKPVAKACAIYASNGTMKTSFAKTFEAISKNSMPSEERYKRTTICEIKIDNIPISAESIYVLKSEVDIKFETPAVTNILVNPIHKANYDALLVELDMLKGKLINSLQKLSKEKKLDIEQKLQSDWEIQGFQKCIEKALSIQISDNLQPFEYATIFDPKALDVLKSKEFISKADEFNKRYQELFESAGSIYTKGVFNPIKAETSFDALKKHGFFLGGHRVHLKGDDISITDEQLEIRQKQLLEKFDTDASLKKIRTSLAKNAQTQALINLIEGLSNLEVEFLLENLKPDMQIQFRRNLWAYYIQKIPESITYIQSYEKNKEALQQIENAAAQMAPQWTQAVELFNDRFVDMPFTLSISNQAQAALGKEKADLLFIFHDGSDYVECSRSELKTLSQGEKRALYLLNFIFEVESRKLTNQETLFIFDDIADSFDYKNKHAIIQYLQDLTKIDYFHQLILTHNYDFFRTIASSFVHRDKCLMTSISDTSISLIKAKGIKNYFIGVWKDKVNSNHTILCATVPFTRNLIEYTKGDKDPDYIKLTDLLHWKENTNNISVGDYFAIYNRLFGTSYPINNATIVKDLLFQQANDICVQAKHDGLNLENKVVLCMAIRLHSEIFLINELRILKNEPNYWDCSMNQFGSLMKDFSSQSQEHSALRTLEKVSITVSSNIHLNSFMYEPILDLSMEHLIKLHNEVIALSNTI